MLGIDNLERISIKMRLRLRMIYCQCNNLILTIYIKICRLFYNQNFIKTTIKNSRLKKNLDIISRERVKDSKFY